ncbi:MAG: outer membrane protein assembly factor BamD [Oligoflexales bacterium]
MIKNPQHSKLLRFFRNLITIAVLPFILTHCTEKEFDPADPAGSFAIAREPYDEENWDIALTKLGEFKSRFPYSKHAALAELFIADCQFELENYEEATVAYSSFVKLHPTHEKVDYAMFRVGESYWVQAPEEVDREQEFTHKAIEEWHHLTEKFPDSSYSKTAEERIKEGHNRIARSYEFIADFYCKLEIYHACAYRFEALADKFPEYKDLQKKAYEQAGEALLKLSQKRDEDPESDKNLYFKNFSPQDLVAKAKELKAKADKIN